MKALVFTKYGPWSKSVLFSDSHPKPSASEMRCGELLVEVNAAALNPLDKIRYNGGLKHFVAEKKLPAVIGYDIAGTVIKVAPGTDAAENKTRFSIGDRVVARMGDSKCGSVAEFAIVDADLCAKIPDNLTYVEAASLALSGQTVLQAFRKGGVKEGDRVFVSGGAGGVGTIAIQLAKHVFKAKEVATTARSGEKSDLCRKLGADTVIDYTTHKFEEKLREFDFALDLTHEAERMAVILKKGANIVSVTGKPTVSSLIEIGYPVSLWVKFYLWIIRDNKRINAARKHGVSYHYLIMQPSSKDMNKIVKEASSSRIHAVIDSIHPLNKALDAIKRLESGHAKGKIVISMLDECLEEKRSNPSKGASKSPQPSGKPVDVLAENQALARRDRRENIQEKKEEETRRDPLPKEEKERKDLKDVQIS